MGLALRQFEVPLAVDEDSKVLVGGTRVTLDTVLAAFERGATAEEIVHQYPSLALEDVYAVIGYCLRHRRDVDLYLEERRQLGRQVRASNEARFDPTGIRARLLSRGERADSSPPDSD